jgi:undecaprenyl-diphosphatase
LSEATEAISKIQQSDRVVFDAIATWQTPILDKVMPALSIAASYSRLWIGIAIVLAVFGGRRGRKAAVEGMVTIGVTSFLANLVLKNLVPRRRPTDPVLEQRRLRQPDSSSFPSGHTASAAAFSGIVSRAYPKLWLPLNGLAAAVGFSRVYTGVHYPSDVVAGWMLGKVVAAVMSKVFPHVPWFDEDASD